MWFVAVVDTLFVVEVDYGRLRKLCIVELIDIIANCCLQE